ncbi:MAG: hypothetical protein RL226_1363 [Bacteroidota bacterium]
MPFVPESWAPEHPPQRIISLVPSQTELLFDLGLEKEVVGITKFCVRPEKKWKEVARIGGTKNVRFENVKRLQPDLIIANKEENDKAQIEALAEDYNVLITDVRSVNAALDMIEAVGKATHRLEAAQMLRQKIEQTWEPLQNQTKKRVAYLIWQHPEMLVGPDTYIGQVLAFCGFNNIVEAAEPRYPQMTVAELQDAAPEVIMLSSEPFPFVEKHAARYRTLFPGAEVLLVDGELFSWYGSRMLHAPDYLRSLL